MHQPDPQLVVATWLSQLNARAVNVGFSGGLDSTVLLHACAQQAPATGCAIRALHIDHGLHPDSSAWAAHCVAIAAALEVPIEVLRVRVDRGLGQGLEAAARDARYAAFAEHCADGSVLALAQHRDDQAETVLLRLLRGAGVAGLAGMRAERDRAGLTLARPLLHCPRAALLAYAQRHQLRWLEDPSNADASLDRNFLRHRVLPLLRERWPQAEAALALSAGLLQEAAGSIEQLARRDLATLQGLDPRSLDRSRLRALPGIRQRELLRLWLRDCGTATPPARVLARLDELIPREASPEAALCWRGWRLYPHRDLLLLDHPGLQPRARDWHCEWDGRSPIDLPEGYGRLRFDPGAAEDAGPMSISARGGGERIRLPGRRHHHSLKHALQEFGIPRGLRNRLPLLRASDGEVLAAGDLLISARLHEWQQDRKQRLRWDSVMSWCDASR